MGRPRRSSPGGAAAAGWSGVPPAMREAILAWYDAQGRSLAFRGTRDPYAILVSELMAQQTQVARAAEAWHRFLAAFPSFATLAAATPADVLRAWRGLGYNRRALALRQTAIEVVERHAGQLPRDVAALERLPGIGPYTARAVAALAFGTPVAAVDTNVRRVLLRSMVGDPAAWGTAFEPAGDPAVISPRDLQALADASVPVGRPGDWTHAVMDIGALLCKPRSPRCDDCPARAWCRTASLRPDVTDPAPGASRPGPPVTRRRTHEAPGPFAATSRWLRGRIMDRLRDASSDEWVEVGERIGDHGPEAISGALAALQREGLIERHPAFDGRARLPLA